MRGDIVAEHLFAFGGGEVDDTHSALAQPVDAALKRARFAHDDSADPELHHQPAAIPAGCQRGHHDGVAVAALPASLAEGIGLAVDRRVALLHTPVVTAA